jgi:hypothetical protein
VITKQLLTNFKTFQHWYIVQDLRVLWQWLGRLLSSGIWHCVSWFIGIVSKEPWGQQVPLKCWQIVLCSKRNLNGLLCFRLLGFWICPFSALTNNNFLKLDLFLFFFLQKASLSPCVLFIILDNGHSNPWDVFYWLINAIVFSDLYICFKMSNGDNLQWDFLSIPYVAIVFISKANEFWCVTFEPDVVSVAVTSCLVCPVSCLTFWHRNLTFKF